jgi:[ribosomal protein S5]-alanine N-acetyltransferase
MALVPMLTRPVLPPGALARRRQPTLAGDGIVLRPWRTGDTAAVVQAYSDPDIKRWHARSMSAAEAESWIAAWPDRWAAETGGGWAITDATKVLGQISLRRIDLAEGLSEVSYWVLPTARGRGIATRALCALTGWAFGDLGLHRVELQHSTQNAASCRVAAGAGFQFEGVKRREALHADGWHDMHLHARLADDPGRN